MARITTGVDYSRREQYKRDLLLMLTQMRGPGRGLEMGKNVTFFLRKGYPRPEAIAQAETWKPLLAAAQQLVRERSREFVIVRYKNSEVLCFREDLEKTTSNVAINDMERTGMLRKPDKEIVPGEKGADAADIYDVPPQD